MSAYQIQNFKRKQLFKNELETFELEIFIEKHIETVKQLISCPICWDVVKSIQQHSQCCHILCNDCDQHVMKLQQKCPICRKCWICPNEDCICNDSDSDSDSDSDDDKNHGTGAEAPAAAAETDKEQSNGVTAVPETPLAADASSEQKSETGSSSDQNGTDDDEVRNWLL